jgi:uncharacterized protein YkwD
MTFRRLFIVLTLVVTVFLTAAGPAHAGTKTAQLRNTMLQLVNRSRASHGLHALNLHFAVSSFAWHHSQRMARRNTVYHSSDVFSEVRQYGATYWGENVGNAYTLPNIERAFMASPEHRANILKPLYRRIGIGIVRAHGLVWVTLDFFN